MNHQMENNSIEISAPLKKAGPFEGKIDTLINFLNIGTDECRVKEVFIKRPPEKKDTQFRRNPRIGDYKSYG
jgi:hypothetical protein